jgi:hypothetical protein
MFFAGLEENARHFLYRYIIFAQSLIIAMIKKVQETNEFANLTKKYIHFVPPPLNLIQINC